MSCLGRVSSRSRTDQPEGSSTKCLLRASVARRAPLCLLLTIINMLKRDFDEGALRTVFSHYPSGLAAIAATVNGVDQVMLVATFSVGVSLSPPLVSFAAQKGSSTWAELRNATRVGVSVLSASHQTVYKQLGSKDRQARWKGVRFSRTDDNALLLDEAVATFECAIHAELPAGDHDMVLLEIKGLAAEPLLQPIVFQSSRVRQLESLR